MIPEVWYFGTWYWNSCVFQHGRIVSNSQKLQQQKWLNCAPDQFHTVLWPELLRSVTLQHFILHYTTLNYTSALYTTLCYTTALYTTLNYTTALYTTLHFTTALQLLYTSLESTTLHKLLRSMHAAAPQSLQKCSFRPKCTQATDGAAVV